MPPRTDRLLLVEVVLVLLLFALFLVWYLVPAAVPPFLPYWWAWPVIAVVLFTLLGLETHRRRQRKRAAVEEAVDEVTGNR
jgi:hypothetical protein